MTRRFLLTLAIIIGAWPVVASTQQSSSENFTVSEWVLVQGENTGLEGEEVAVSVYVAPPIGGEAKSRVSSDYMISANFPTDVFAISVLPPRRPYYSEHFDSRNVELAWSASEDEGSPHFEGYRVTLFDTAESDEILEQVTTSTRSVPIELAPGDKQFAKIEAFCGPHTSSPTVRIMFVSTENQPQGDVDGNGRTDGSDFVDALFALNIQKSTGYNAAADIDDDGVVDGDDLAVIAGQMGWKQ